MYKNLARVCMSRSKVKVIGNEKLLSHPIEGDSCAAGRRLHAAAGESTVWPPVVTG